jgi:hypothetical protein
MSYATSDSAPHNTAIRRPRSSLHGHAAGLLRTGATPFGNVTSRMAERSASPNHASSKRPLMARATLMVTESMHVSTLRSTARIAQPVTGTIGRHRPIPGLIQPRHSSTFRRSSSSQCPSFADEVGNRDQTRTTLRPIADGSCRARRQRRERQSAPRTAKLSGSLDRRMGLHRGIGNRGLPRWRRDRSRAGRAFAHGALGSHSTSGGTAGRSGAKGTRPRPGVHRARPDYRSGRNCRQRRRPHSDPVYPRGPFYHRRNPLSTSTFRTAPVTVPVWR